MKSKKVQPVQLSPKEKLAKEMRDNPTVTERLMADLLTVNGISFKSQVVMLGYIADFYIKGAKSIIEVDGSIHKGREEYDSRRDSAFRDNGFQVLRIQSSRLFTDPQGVAADVEKHLDWSRSVKRATKGTTIRKRGPRRKASPRRS